MPRTATEADIKKAYRRLAMKLSPGPQSGRQGSRREVQGGQGSLRSSLRRATSAPSTTSTATPASTPRAWRRRGGPARRRFGDIFGDMFGDIFGGGRRGGGRSQVFRGADLRYELELDLEPGGVRPLRVEIDVPKLVRVRDLRRQRRGQGLATRSPATPATARARCASRRASSSCSRPARSAAAPARSSRIPATPASARAACAAQEAGGEDSRRASTPAIASACRARARRAATAGRRAICMWKCTCASTRSSSATATHLCCEVPVSFATAALGGTVERADARWSRVAQDSRRNPVRPGVPAARQGRQAGARRRARRSVLPRGRGDAGQPLRRTARAAAASGRIAP